jgi:hypothetical protein
MDDKKTPNNEVQLTGLWRTSSFSDGGQCVELAPTSDGVALRHSKDHSQGTLEFAHSDFKALIEGIKAGQFDDLT